MSQKNTFVTTTELAKMLGISRIAVFKKIKAGRIRAVRAGRNYLIARRDLAGIIGSALTRTDKEEIDRSVRKAISEYGETFRLLGKE